MKLLDLIQLTKEQNKGFIESFQKVALATSGGSDSIALFHVFLEISKKNYFSDLIVLHVNFGLRGEESDRDEAFVRQLCIQNNTVCHVLRPFEHVHLGRDTGESVQMWARRVRMKWFNSFYENGFQIALGHTLDDLVENVFLRLARGTKSAHLGGMCRLDGMLWRPFLSVSKSQLKSTLQVEELSWAEDSSNTSSKYTRNRVRNELLPLFESIFPNSLIHIAQWSLAMAESKAGEASHNEDLAPEARLVAGANPTHTKIKSIEAFLKSAKPGGSLQLEGDLWLTRSPVPPTAKDSSKIRENQHLASLDGRHCELILSPKDTITSGTSRLELAEVLEECSYEDGFCQVSKTTVIKINPASPKSEVRIAESKAAFKFKDLMQKWSIPIVERVNFVNFETIEGKKIFCRMVEKPSHKHRKLEF